MDIGDDKLSCAHLAQITNILIDRGTLPFMYIYNNINRHVFDGILCKYCENMAIRAACGIKYQLFQLYKLDALTLSNGNTSHSVGYRFSISRADLVAALKHGSDIPISYLVKYDLLDREISLLLMQNKIFTSYMCKYITCDDVRAQLSYSVSDMYMHAPIYDIYPGLYDAQTLDMVISELNRDCDRDILINRYARWSNEFRCFPRDLQDKYRDQLIQLFPLIVLGGYYRVDEILTAATQESCDYLIYLLDLVMLFSDDRAYILQVKSYLEQIIIGHHSFVKFTKAIQIFIIEKHQQYLIFLLSATYNRCGKSAEEIWNKYDKIQLIKDCVKYDVSILRYLPESELCNIGAELLNKYIRRHMSYDQCTISDFCKVKYAVDLDDETISKTLIYVKHIINELYEPIKINIDAGMQISIGHILTLARNNVKFLQCIRNDDLVKYIMPRIYQEFISGMCKISAICAQMAMPSDVVDIIKLYYIKPDADSDDIVQMLRRYSCEKI
jgi:hypothetical protein